MRITPNLPLPEPLPVELWEVGHVEAATVVKPVVERTVTPQVVYHRANGVDDFADMVPPFVERRVNGERRKSCRRLNHEQHQLLDTRSGVERRHINRRRSDIKTTIEEEI